MYTSQLLSITIVYNSCELLVNMEDMGMDALNVSGNGCGYEYLSFFERMSGHEKSQRTNSGARQPRLNEQQILQSSWLMV